MNINHLETFINVARFKSFHKAAKALFLSQPTISARIKSLEKELDTELFIRHGKGVLLTKSGKEFITYAEKVIQVYNEGKKRMQNKDTQKEIVIGTSAIIAQYFIPFVLPLLKDSNEFPRLTFTVDSPEMLEEKLLRNKIDIAVSSESSNDKILKKRLFNNRLKLVTFPKNPLRKENHITLERLGEEEIIISDLGLMTVQKIQKLFNSANIEPRMTSHVNHIEVAKAVLKNGNAIGFLPYLCVKNELESDELIEIDVNHLFQEELPIFLKYTNPEITNWQLLKDLKVAGEKFVNLNNA